MPRPRVFISSTFYDLRQIRSDIESFVLNLGFEPVLFERGHIAYTLEEPLEDSAYDEIKTCDILIAIIGGRFGSQSKERPYSITQKEIQQAQREGVQVYTFVERFVLSEYKTYLRNKDKPNEIRWAAADDIRIYEFIDAIHSLPVNNFITDFGYAQDITSFLKEQWAGLFQKLLQQRPKQETIDLTNRLNESAKILSTLVDFVYEDKKAQIESNTQILLSIHPLFPRLAEVVGAKYRIFFYNKDELTQWMNARSFAPIKEGEEENRDYYEWKSKQAKSKTEGTRVETRIGLHKELFDSTGSIIPVVPSDWKDDWIKTWQSEVKKADSEITIAIEKAISELTK